MTNNKLLSSMEAEIEVETSDVMSEIFPDSDGYSTSGIIISLTTTTRDSNVLTEDNKRRLE